MKPAPATANLCDVFPDRVRIAAALFRDWGGVSRFAGTMETVRVFEDNGLVRELLTSEGRGRVLVVDGGGSLERALVGGNLAALARDNGWTGIVVNGAIRDSVEIATTAVGVKALATTPMKSAKAGTGERGVPVTFARVTFVPGQWLYADSDGIIVADQELLTS